MAMEPVKQHLIQYSHIQSEYWFYDLDHPRVIAFCRNGRWEAEYIHQVQHTARDPRIIDVAVTALRQQAQVNAIPSPQLPTPTTATAPPVPSASQLNGGMHLPPLRNALYPNTPTSLHPNSPLSPVSTSSQPSAHNSPAQDYQPPPAASSYAYYPAYPHLPGTTDSRSPFTSTKNPTWNRWASGEWQRGHPQSIDTNLPMNNQQPQLRQMKILLSLDGDGIRGLSAAMTVDALVKAVSKRIGRRLEPYQIFDIIGGTSTGGLLAIMLGRLRMPSDTAVDAYLKLSKTMFKNKSHFFKHKQHLLRVGSQLGLAEPLSDQESLEWELKKLVGEYLKDGEELFWDTRPDSPNIFVISTHVFQSRLRPALIRSYSTRRITNPVLKPTLKTWEAMCATAAGLCYTNNDDPTAETSGLLVDGSIKKSNPVKDVFFECRSLYHINDPMMIVSVGAGGCLEVGTKEGNNGGERNASNSSNPEGPRPNGVSPNFPSTPNTTTSPEFKELAENIAACERHSKSTADKFEWDQHDILNTDWLKYFRFNDPGMATIGLEEYKERDGILASTMRYLQGADGEGSEKFKDCVEAIVRVLMRERDIASPAPNSGTLANAVDSAVMPTPTTPGLENGYPGDRAKRRKIG
ncbi:FabD/lysophospholipase-like protein [Delitschia confertaspora ATCC 74209]|uniref:FabD/lysophospholipase-like protein n=1 Tax=Delitschia confertaspora ATCC 74209 TaxID=1513339 RepID=A0A9P4JXQ0_9PLEO|nr:FabD/lysophospholipase-like protein [Delitschia confertaspora ATCC 74209]